MKNVYVVIEEDAFGCEPSTTIVDVFEKVEDAQKCLQECKEDFYQNTNFDEDRGSKEGVEISDTPNYFQYFDPYSNENYEVSIVPRMLK